MFPVTASVFESVVLPVTTRVFANATLPLTVIAPVKFKKFVTLIAKLFVAAIVVLPYVTLATLLPIKIVVAFANTLAPTET